jgi:type IV pilus assembly protein PilB
MNRPTMSAIDAASAEVQALLKASAGDDGAVVRLLDRLLQLAHDMWASDLHFEPYEGAYRIRIRVDGQLQEWLRPPLGLRERLASRIKVQARLDIAEKRLPQDGRMRQQMSGGRWVDLRVSTLPTVHGEKLVLRLIDAAPSQLDLDELGYDEAQKAALLQAIARPHGMVLVTGPTGAGKTLSMYSCLQQLNRPGVNICTAEDPCEINLGGINQVSINEKAGLNFAAALRAFLRQDPDVIMIGEIRDLETADMALKAAQTGHLVFSTLHTNDAPSTLTRLRHIGVAAHNIAASVALITAQRLLRRLCVHCRQPVDLPRPLLLEAACPLDWLDDGRPVYAPVGCALCQGGYLGRVGVFQVMPISLAMTDIILREGSALDMARQAASEGVLSLRHAAWGKVKLGQTSIEEVLAHTHA